METWDPSVKIFYPIKKLPFSTEISAEFCRHSALSGGVSPERRNENIKYFIPLSKNWTHNRRVYRSILGPLRHDGLIYKYESYRVWSFIALVYKGRDSVEDCSSYKGLSLRVLPWRSSSADQREPKVIYFVLHFQQKRDIIFLPPIGI